MKNYKNYILNENLKQAKEILAANSISSNSTAFQNIVSELKNKPNLIGKFTELWVKDRDKLGEIISTIRWINSHKNLINLLSKQLLQYQSIEELHDDIKKTEDKQNIHLYLNTLYANIREYINKLIDSGNTEIVDLIRSFITLPKEKQNEFPPIRVYKNLNPDLFVSALKEFISKGKLSSKSDIMNIIKKYEDVVEIVYDTDNILIVTTNDKNAVKELGSDKWCIVNKQESFFETYCGYSTYNTQYIIFNFNIPSYSQFHKYGISMQIDETPAYGGCQDNLNMSVNLNNLKSDLEIPDGIIISRKRELYKTDYNKKKEEMLNKVKNENNVIYEDETYLLVLNFNSKENTDDKFQTNYKLYTKTSFSLAKLNFNMFNITVSENYKITSGIEIPKVIVPYLKNIKEKNYNKRKIEVEKLINETDVHKCIELINNSTFLTLSDVLNKTSEFKNNIADYIEYCVYLIVWVQKINNAYPYIISDIDLMYNIIKNEFYVNKMIKKYNLTDKIEKDKLNDQNYKYLTSHNIFDFNFEKLTTEDTDFDIFKLKFDTLLEYFDVEIDFSDVTIFLETFSNQEDKILKYLEEKQFDIDIDQIPNDEWDKQSFKDFIVAYYKDIKDINESAILLCLYKKGIQKEEFYKKLGLVKYGDNWLYKIGDYSDLDEYFKNFKFDTYQENISYDSSDFEWDDSFNILNIENIINIAKYLKIKKEQLDFKVIKKYSLMFEDDKMKTLFDIKKSREVYKEDKELAKLRTDIEDILKEDEDDNYENIKQAISYAAARAEESGVADAYYNKAIEELFDRYFDKINDKTYFEWLKTGKKSKDDKYDVEVLSAKISPKLIDYCYDNLGNMVNYDGEKFDYEDMMNLYNTEEGKIELSDNISGNSDLDRFNEEFSNQIDEIK